MFQLQHKTHRWHLDRQNLAKHLHPDPLAQIVGYFQNTTIKFIWIDNNALRNRKISLE